MKRITLLFVGLLSLPFFSYSGGIVTNQNQSAAYIRMFARDASTDIDAVFFNPAGLTKLDDGFHLSLNYQYINQNKVVTSDYPYLANTPVDYEGKISVPIFPGVYAAYKTGKFVFSFGWNPVGGGGGATFDRGLPSFEIPLSDLAAAYSAQGVTGYSLDAYFEGSSVFWGYQLGASYEINDMISVYLGARYVTAKNTYSGHLNDLMLTTLGGPVPARNFLEGVGDQLEATSNTIAGAITLGYIDPNAAFADPTGIETLTRLGAYQPGMTNAQAATAFGQSAVVMDLNAALLRDQEGEIEQTGSGIAPIIGANINLLDKKLNIGLKYEFMTKLELENNTTQDFYTGLDASYQEIGMFPDGAKTRNDMPAMFAVGFDYKITDKFSVASGFHMYFDKSADYGREIDDVHVDNDEVIDRNSTEFALGLEYKVTDKLLLSIGYLNTQTGVTEDYQTDLSYSQNSNTIGLGGAYAISSGIKMNVGFGYTVYNDARKIYDYNNKLGQTVVVTEEYDKDNLFVAFGLDFKLWNKKSE
ncbi:MAG TPA: hypothetical protein DCG75_12260 [Bacteroidales bacterium]|nr:hypothetical protein [Bacteroidales bacterium]